MTGRFGVLLLMLLWVAPAWTVSNISSTRHNLSSAGPGTVKSTTIGEVCVFCHTPHHSAPQAPLWNRALPSGQTYQLYGSTTLQATPEDPQLRSGSPSLLCLSCHDGTIALGDFVNPSQEDLAFTFQTGDRGLLGTDFRDDHPFSFVYDTALAASDPLLKNPGAGGANIAPLPLAGGSYMECTTCHDVHDNTIPPFLHVQTLNGDLCITCHEPGLTGLNFTGSSHASSTKTTTAASHPERRPEWLGANVAENSCMNCHTPHNAATPARLIKNTEEATCYLCHNGTVASSNISADVAKTYNHPVDVTPNANHDVERLENPLSMTLHAECPDCHNPHTVGGGTVDPMITFNPNNLAAAHTTPPNANARITGVQGITQAGAVTQNIQFQYELCYKCHGLPNKGPCPGSVDPMERCPSVVNAGMDKRVDGVYNIREKVDPSSLPVSIPGDPGPATTSYHPIVQNNPGNEVVDSLRTDVTFDTIYCTDCHNSDTSAAAGGAGANGPHGSNNPVVMALNYSLGIDQQNPPATNFAICYKCHSQAIIESDSTGFPHNAHINSRGGGCVLCHDPHGSRFRDRLINFWWEDPAISRSGIDCVSRDKKTGLCDYTGDGFSPRWDHNTGGNHGSCLLSCHGTGHGPKTY